MNTPPPNTVSYQSTFIGLIPLALNAMSQASILDRTFLQSSFLFPARSSPFVCLADALEVVVEIAFYAIWEGMGIRHAAGRSCWRRARSEMQIPPTRVEATGVDQHPKTFMILSIGAILQAVKTLSVQCIPLTQLYASFCLLSFLVLAGARQLAAPGWRDGHFPLGHNIEDAMNR